MQTFLPSPSFTHSAACLDARRLGKQRVECKQMLIAIHDPSYGWQNHPCTKMWRPYPRSMALYAMEVCTQWVALGYRDSVAQWLFEAFDGTLLAPGPVVHPPWLGNPAFHSAHRSKLYHKLPAHYGQFHWPEADQPEKDYLWPSF